MQINYKWWFDPVLSKIWLDLILLTFCKINLFSEKHKFRINYFWTCVFHYINIFCKKLKYRIKPKFSNDRIRQSLVFFFLHFWKKITTTGSSHSLSPNGQGYNCAKYTGSLASADFSGCVFHSCAFSKNSPNIQLMWFSLYKWRNSFTHAFWVTNDFKYCRFGPCGFLPSLKKSTIQGPVYIFSLFYLEFYIVKFNIGLIEIV